MEPQPGDERRHRDRRRDEDAELDLDGPHRVQRAGEQVQRPVHPGHQRGHRGTFSPLFKGFPNRLPAFDDARTRFTVASVRLLTRALTAVLPATEQ